MIGQVQWWALALAAFAFAVLAVAALFASAKTCARIVPFDDGPRTGSSPKPLLIAAAAAIGAVSVAQNGVGLRLAASAILVSALVACWDADVRCGIVPDRFTLAPLAAIVGIGIVEREWFTLGVALLVTLPFAIAAYLSKGLGMGWGDVKLVALGSAALGDRSILAFAAACLVAAAVAAIRKRTAEPIAFAPYLAAAIALAAVVPALPLGGTA